MNRFSIATVLLVTTVVSTALGEDTEPRDFAHSGGFIGFGFTWAEPDFSAEAGAFSATVGADGSPAIDLRGGYRFNPYVSLEGDFQYYFDFDTVAAVSARGFSFMPQVKGYPLPTQIWGGRIQPFVGFGMGVLVAQLDSGFSTSEDATLALRFGGGLDVYFTEHWLLDFEAGYQLDPLGMDFDSGGSASLKGSMIPITTNLQYRW